MIQAILVLFLLAGGAIAQERPGLLFREDFKETPAAIPITQDDIANPGLRLALYGPGASLLKKSHHDKPADDPYYMWSGLAKGNWAASLSRKSGLIDLTGQAKIRWRTKQAGFRQLRIILKLAGGGWLVSDQFDPAAVDWRLREFNIAGIHWRELDIKNVVEGNWVEHPDLSRVEEVGWTDLMRGGQSKACSRIDWIEVYARPVAKN